MSAPPPGDGRAAEGGMMAVIEKTKVRRLEVWAASVAKDAAYIALRAAQKAFDEVLAEQLRERGTQ